jgi:hypothetical protein
MSEVRRAAVAIRSADEEASGESRSGLGETFAALKRITFGKPEVFVMMLRVSIRLDVLLTSQMWVETVTVGWVVVMVDAVAKRLDGVRETRVMCVKDWEAKWRAVERAMPGPEAMMRRCRVWGGIMLVVAGCVECRSLWEG